MCGHGIANGAHMDPAKLAIVYICINIAIARGTVAKATEILQVIQTTFDIALSSAYTKPHCELLDHKQRIESSPLRQSGSGYGLGNQSSLQELLMRRLTDMLHKGEGEGEGRGRRLLKLPTLPTQLHILR